MLNELITKSGEDAGPKVRTESMDVPLSPEQRFVMWMMRQINKARKNAPRS